MSIVTIFAASYCHGEEIAKGVAKELGYELLGEEVLQQAAEQIGATAAKLQLVMAGRPGPFGRVMGNKERQVAAIRTALVEAVKGNNVVYHGFAGHLIPRTVAHALQVCILANRSYRMTVAMDQRGLSQKKALHLINRDDEDRGRWTDYLFHTHPWDKDLYDVQIPIHQQSVEDAVAIICELAQRPEIDEAAEFEMTLEDFALGSAAALKLAEGGVKDAEVEADEGKVVVRVPNVKALSVKIEAIVGAVDGVAEVVVEPEDAQPTTEESGATTRKVLLVDDEEEYVHTLSQRLQVREFESTVALDGAEALAAVGDAAAEVIVVDLHMPGIDGFEVLRQVKDRNPDTAVIVLTGHGSEEAKAKAFELGAFAFLEKPVEIDELTRVMNEAYDHIERRRGG